MASTVTLCFQWPAGSATFNLTPQEALKVTVALRKLGLGLTYKNGQPMVTCATAKFTAAEAIIKKMRK